VLGGSGSGKSSVIRAGLMPRLTSTMAIRERSGNWYAAEFRPRLDPMEELATALAELVRRKFPEQQADIPAEIEPGTAATESALHEAVLSRIRADLQLGAEGDGRAEISTQPEDRIRRAEMLCDGLFDFVNNELDRRDLTATRGYRSGRPSLLLVIDQFEEVFRPEVPVARAGGRQDLLDMIIAACARIDVERGANPEDKSGLFIAITMRSEELHRCAEHPSLGVTKDGAAEPHSLADLVNRSCYLLDLLDPEQDHKELTDAIVQPARRVFKDWGLPFDPDHEHTPFEPDVVGWLLDGAAQLSQELEHRADQLPLLQHALQTMWHRAVEDWERMGADRPLIGRRHLGVGGAEGSNLSADLVACLDARADEARKHAIQQYMDAVKPEAPAEPPQLTPSAVQTQSLATPRLAAVRKTIEKHLPSANAPSDPATTDANSQADDKYRSGGEAAIRAAFRSLARRDDRGYWARRFAELARIEQFADADPDALEIPADLQERGLRAALGEFIAAGYLTGGDRLPYDISHEALIRNWRDCQLWLLAPEASAQALVQAVNFLDPVNPTDFVSLALARNLAFAVGETATLPESWAKEQIIPILSRRDVREKWSKQSSDRSTDEQLAEDVLKEIDLACKLAERERYQHEANAYWLNYVARRNSRALKIVGALGTALLATWLSIAVFIAFKWFRI
jgi:Novel STAND NTPase 1